MEESDLAALTVCDWHRHEGGIKAFDTECGCVFTFHDDTNSEDFTYCPYCGKVTKVVEETDD